MSRSRRHLLFTALCLVPLLGSCAADDETVIGPVTPETGGELFTRYVALGNSITAGIQSGGITAATQAQAYPVLVAQQAGAEFAYPRLFGRGCTPPYRGPFLLDTVRVGPGSTSRTCDLLASPTPVVVQNLAVPSAAIGDALDNLRAGSASNVLTTLFLGGRTQVEAMIDAQPTLVSVWLGNNDLLGGAGAGDTTRLTSAAAFAARVDSLAAAIRQTPAGSGEGNRDAVLLGIAPFPALLQPGAYLFAQFQQDTAAFRARTGKTVNANCSPLNPATGQPNPVTFSLVSLAVFGQPAITEINCAGIPGLNSDFVLTAAEQQRVFTRVEEYNAALRSAAEENGWIYIDTNEVLGGAGTNAFNLRQRLDPQRFRLCQGLYTATPATFLTALVTTCPAPTPPTAAYAPGAAEYANFFGTWLTFDAIHPSATFQRAIADAIIAALNAKHGLSIPPVAT